jgi:hypothetical protein
VKIYFYFDFREPFGQFKPSLVSVTYPHISAGADIMATIVGRKLQRMLFRTVELEEDKAKHQLLYKPDNDLRIDLARALESLPAH